MSKESPGDSEVRWVVYGWVYGGNDLCKKYVLSEERENTMDCESGDDDSSDRHARRKKMKEWQN